MSKISQLEHLDRLILMLKELAGQLLGIVPSEIDIDASFFTMGADSLILLQVSQLVREKFGIKIPFRLLFEEFPTLRTLAMHINEHLSTAEEQEQIAMTDHSYSAIEKPLLEEKSYSSEYVIAASELPSMGSNANSNSSQTTVVSRAIPEIPNDSEHGLFDDTIEIERPSLEHIVGSQLRIMSQQLELFKSSAVARGKNYVSGSTSLEQSKEVNAAIHSGMQATYLEKEENRSTITTGTGTDRETHKTQSNAKPFVANQSIQMRLAEELSACQKRHLKTLISSVTKRTKGSKQIAANNRPHLADSRASAGFRLLWKEMQYPLFVERGVGARIWDVDGNEYVDLATGFGSLLFGHSPPFITEALQQQIQHGIRIGGASPITGKVARLICELTGVERVTFCNSGTEAVMAALRIARAVTGRPKIALFAGCYHGTYDEVMVRSDIIEHGNLYARPIAPGVPEHIVNNVMLLEFGSPESLETLYAHKDELAAVLLEPIPSRHPEMQSQSYLQQLRELTQRTGIALVFDEVVTGFRFHPGGAQALFDVQADLVAFGKAMGGGLPVSAVAGKAVYMDAVDGGQWNYGDSSYPEANTTFVAGTYFKHPLIMPIVWSILNHIKDCGPQLQKTLNHRTQQLVKTLNAYFDQSKIPLNVTSFGSLFRFTCPSDFKFMDLFYYHLLVKGVYICETRGCCLSTAHTDDDIDHIFSAVKETVGELQAGGFLPVITVSGSNDHITFSNGTGQELDSPNSFQLSSMWQTDSTTLVAKQSDELLHDTNEIPLTPFQSDIWVTSQLGDEASRAFNESIVLELQGMLEVKAMNKAIREVVNRHEALRTTFSPDGNHQRVHPLVKMDTVFFDFSQCTIGERQTKVEQWLTETAEQTFDLVQGPLLRVYIAKLEEKRHLLVLILHHIITDGVSNGVLLQEISVIYAAECEGTAYQLPQPVQFREYIEWYLRQQDTPKYTAAARYWSEQFARPIPVLDLPTDYLRPPIPTYAGALQSLTIDTLLTKQLKTLSIQQHCSLFIMLLAGFNVLLHRLSNQDEIVITIPVGGQPLMGANNLIGLCLTMLPLRSQASGDLTFLNYVAHIKKIFFEMHEHQAYPLNKLLKKMSAGLHPVGRSPVPVGFNLDRSSREFEIGDLRAELIMPFAHTAKFDINWNITQTDSDLLVQCEYDIDLFDAVTIQRILRHYKELLTEIVAQPDQRIDELSLLIQADREQLQTKWNDTRIHYSQANCIHELFEDQAERTPDSIALVFENQKLTYGELNRRANQLAHYLQKQGVRPEERVGICLERSAEMVIGILAVLKAGGAYVPLDPSYPQARLAFLVRDAQLKVLVAQEKFLKIPLESDAKAVYIDSDSEMIAEEKGENPISDVLADNLAYVIYTSGSTGNPKGVGVSHYNVARLLQATEECFDFSSSDVWTLFHSYAFDFSVWELWGALAYGGRILVIPHWMSQTPEAFYALIRAERVTILNQTPSAFRQFAYVDGETMPEQQGKLALRWVIFGGEALNLSTLKSWYSRQKEQAPQLVNMYGITETTIHVTYRLLRVQDVQTAPESMIGAPIRDLQVYILDQRWQPVPVGIPGELYVGGAGLARGYLNQARLTAERFVPNPFSDKPGERLYRTGDLARYSPDGNIIFLGRCDQQVKLRGYRIELGEIEAVLTAHPDVREVVATIQEEVDDKQLVAYVVSKLEPAPTANQLRDYLSAKLPEYMVPAHFVLLDALPLTPNGKLDYQALPQLDRTSAAVTDYVAPLTMLEKQLSVIWSEILGIEPIGIHDNLIELGGDSITAIHIVSRARQIGIKFPARTLFTHPTIAELVTVIGSNSSTLHEQTVVTGTVPLTPIQHWLFGQDLQNPHYFNQSFLFEVKQRLDPRIVEKSWHYILSHHDALRLRFLQNGAGWQQINIGLDTNTTFFHTFDLSKAPLNAQQNIIEDISGNLQSSLNFEETLIRVALMDLGDNQPQRLLIIIHHLVVDFVSWRILLEDLQTAYEYVRLGEDIQLPHKTTSFKGWSEQLKKYAQLEKTEQTLKYWFTAPYEQILPLPVDYPENRDMNVRSSSNVVSVSLNSEMTKILIQEIPAAYQTQVYVALLAALVQAFAKWTGKSLLLIDLEGHGREEIGENIDVSRTVGWFTSIYPVLLDIRESQEHGDGLSLIQEQLRRVPEGGITYAIVRHLSNNAQIVEQLGALPQAEVVFNYWGQVDQGLSENATFGIASEAIGPTQDPHGKRCYLLEIDGSIINNQLHMNWTYSQALHNKTTIEHLAQEFIDSLMLLITHCHSHEEDRYKASDFPGVNLSQNELNAFIAKIS